MKLIECFNMKKFQTVPIALRRSDIIPHFGMHKIGRRQVIRNGFVMSCIRPTVTYKAGR